MLWFRAWVDACHWCVTWAASGRLHGEGRPLARRAAFVPTSTLCSMADKFTTPVSKLSRLPASTARSSAIKRDSLAAELERGECHCHPSPPLSPTTYALPSHQLVAPLQPCQTHSSLHRRDNSAHRPWPHTSRVPRSSASLWPPRLHAPNSRPSYARRRSSSSALRAIDDGLQNERQRSEKRRSESVLNALKKRSAVLLLDCFPDIFCRLMLPF